MLVERSDVPDAHYPNRKSDSTNAVGLMIFGPSRGVPGHRNRFLLYPFPFTIHRHKCVCQMISEADTNPRSKALLEKLMVAEIVKEVFEDIPVFICTLQFSRWPLTFKFSVCSSCVWSWENFVTYFTIQATIYWTPATFTFSFMFLHKNKLKK